MTEVEVLTSRLIDRPSRPLFPKGWRFDTQVIALVVSTDRENASDVLAMTGASTALHLSDIPWAGPYAGVRVGRIDGQAGRQPDLRRAGAVGSRPAGRRQPRRDRDGRGGRSRGRRGRHRRRPHVRAPGGAAAHRPAGEAAGRGRQAQARVRPAGQGSGDRRQGRGARQPEDRGGDGHPRQARALLGARFGGRGDQGRARGDVPGAGRRGRRGLRVGEEEAPARARAQHRPPHRRAGHHRDPHHHLRGRACCPGRTARRCSRAARRSRS